MAAAALAHTASCSRTAMLARPSRTAAFSSRVAVPRFHKRSQFVVRAEKVAVVATEVDDETWESDVLKSDLPVLVDFWAPWCGPCRFIAPLIDELAEEYNGRMKFVKLNTDQSPKTATELGIRSIPTVMIFKRGAKMDSVIGAVPKATLKATLEKYL